MLFVYPTPQYPRKGVEYIFKPIYFLTNTVHVIALSVLIADFYTRLGNSIPDYFTSSHPELYSGIQLVLSNCSYTGPIKLGQATMEAEVSVGSVSYGLLTAAQHITALFSVEFLLIVLNIISSMNYSTGNRHLRVCGIHVPFYHGCVLMAYVFNFAIVAIAWSFEANRHFFQRGLDYCAAQVTARDPTALLAAEYNNLTIFTTAVYWPFAASCFCFVVYVAALITRAYNSYDAAQVLLSEADAPWEARGVMCATSKPLLKLHTTQRNGILEDARQALAEGTAVRIVRSYQLMTEDDFDALVRAMRQQVDAALKQKQFEKLIENFGDNEEQIDHTGFHWRQQMAAPVEEEQLTGEEGQLQTQQPNAAAAGDEGQFFDVPFDEYYNNDLDAQQPQQPQPQPYDDDPAYDEGYEDAYGYGHDGYMEPSDAYSPRTAGFAGEEDGGGDDAAYGYGDDDGGEYGEEYGEDYDYNDFRGPAAAAAASGGGGGGLLPAEGEMLDGDDDGFVWDDELPPPPGAASGGNRGQESLLLDDGDGGYWGAEDSNGGGRVGAAGSGSRSRQRAGRTSRNSRRAQPDEDVEADELFDDDGFNEFY